MRMNIKQVGALICIALLFAVGYFLAASVTAPGDVVPPNSVSPQSACGGDCGLLIEPDDGMEPVLSMIARARKSIDLVMYELDDQTIEAALVQAATRGVTVRVLLSEGYQGEPSAVNEPVYDVLKASGVAVRWAPEYFDLTHEKSFVVDGNEGCIMSFNLVKKFYPTGRDFGIMDENKNDVVAMEHAFNDDWQGSGSHGVQAEAASPGNNLVWSPGSRSAILALIAGATASLDIYNEEMADGEVMGALLEAAARGVAVRIIMTYSSEWASAFQKLVDGGVQVSTYSANAKLYIHAKMILVDDAQAFVGSENFSETSLDHNRELGIMLSNRMIVAALKTTFESDWQSARPFH